MLSVSLHGIVIKAPIGLYPEEKIVGNTFETDVDIWLPDVQPWPFADYSIVHQTVHSVFAAPHELIETVVFDIHTILAAQFPFAQKIRVAVRKLAPPLSGQVAFSQVCYER
jgi:7,8-dihydroneopterin aldolase/epimerase/oxygenase